jgi:hypothetical protein
VGNRIYYAVQQVGIRSAKRTNDDGAFSELHGVQSVSINSAFSNSPIPTLGEVPVYANVEDSQEVNLTLKKVLDGYYPIYILATEDSNTPLLVECLEQQCSIALSIFDDSKTYAQGTPLDIMQCSGLSISFFEYNLDVNDVFTESVSFIGNNKVWNNDIRIVNNEDRTYAQALFFDGVFSGVDTPFCHKLSRRQHILLNSADTGVFRTYLPTGIPGIQSNGLPDNSVHIQRINIKASVSYDTIFGLGNKIPFCRKPNLPIPIITDITLNAVSGDRMSMTNMGVFTPGLCQYIGNTSPELINIHVCDGITIGLGNNNRLTSVNYGGGDVGGGVVQTTYTYTTYNMCTILHSNCEDLQ